MTTGPVISDNDMPATMSDLSGPLESYWLPGFGADALASLLSWLTMKLIGPDHL